MFVRIEYEAEPTGDDGGNADKGKKEKRIGLLVCDRRRANSLTLCDTRYSTRYKCSP
jgi:hypothetical protein